MRLVLAGVLAMMASNCLSETVQVVAGANSIAQGWMFLAQDGRCKVLTAGHVVLRSGKPVPVMVRDRRKREIQGAAPEVASLSPDIAVFALQVGASPKACSASRLSMIGVDRRAQQLRQGMIERTGFSEVARYKVERVASGMDKDGGQTIAVRPVDPTVDFREGWSGSILLDEEGPLGVVISAEEKEAIVLRIDALGRVPTAARKLVAEGVDGPTITVVHGETVDASRGPRGMMDAAVPAWLVAPRSRRIEFDIEFKNEMTLTGLTVGLEDGPRLVLMEVAAGIGERGFITLRQCAAGSPSQNVTCPFAAQTRRIFRITLATEGDGPVAIRSLDVK